MRCELSPRLSRELRHHLWLETDPHHAAASLDLKRGWTGINNTHAIFRMHNLF